MTNVISAKRVLVNERNQTQWLIFRNNTLTVTVISPSNANLGSLHHRERF
jgi:hypothetical protein